MSYALLVVALAAATLPESAPPAAIPSAQLVRAAESAYAELQRIADLAGPDTGQADLIASIANVERDVNQLRSAVSATRNAAFDIEAADYLGREVARRQALASRWDDELSARVQLLDGAGASLRRLMETWRLTVDALDAEVPAPLVTRARDVRDRVAQMERVVREQLGGVLELQDRVAAVKLALSVLFASLASADAWRRQQLLAIEGTPLWRKAAWSGMPGSSGALRAGAMQLRVGLAYLAAEPLRATLHVVLTLALIAIGLAVTRRLRASSPSLPSRPLPVQVVTKHPVESALLMAASATPLLHPDRPPALSLLITLIAFVPIARIADVLAPAWRRPVRWLALLFVAGRLVAFAPPAEPSSRVALLGLAIVAALVFAAGLRRAGWLRRLDGGRWKPWILAVAGIAVILLAVSAIANLVGNVSLAKLLAEATLASLFGGIAIAALVAAAGGSLRALLELPSSRRFRLVRDHEEMVVRRGRFFMRAAAVVLWVFFSLRAFEVAQPFGRLVAGTLGLRLKVGGLDLAVGDCVAFAATLLIAVWLSRAVKFLLDEAVLPSLAVKRGSAAAISTTAQYAVVGIGFGSAVLAAGVEMTRFTVLAGTLGVGIGFGLQNVVNNFVSGLILLYEQPVQVGDVIEVGRLTGEVRRIGVRSSTVRTFHGADVIVPNSQFISAEVVNWTASDRWRRADIALGVAYGTDPKRVSELLLGIAKSCPTVAPMPEPIALFTGFGESALQFELRAWTSIDDFPTTASALRTSISEVLPRAGIVLAFPQLDLWVRSVPEVTGKPQMLSAGAQLPAVPQPFGGFRSSREPKK